MKELGLSEDFLKRPVNAGFPVVKKSRNEILQMAMLKPKLAVLDETDSGLDIDALRIVADGVQPPQGDGQRAGGHHRALSAAARLHRAGLRARALRRPNHQVRRQDACA